MVACTFLVAEKTQKKKRNKKPDHCRNLISATNRDGKPQHLCACKLAKKDKMASITEYDHKSSRDMKKTGQGCALAVA